MPQFLNVENLTGLGWSLLNSIWQMAILWLLYVLLTGTGKRFSATARYNLALFFSALGFGWFLYCLTSPGMDYEGIVHRLPFALGLSPFSALLSPILPVLTLIYLLILLFCAGRYFLGFYQLKLNKRRSGIFLSEPLQLFSDRITAAMGIRKPVSILLVNWADTAQTIGFFKPLVLLPVALVNRLSLEQTETILLHELLHIRRHDYFVNICMTIFRALFFFNPFARLFFKTMARERELACDDGVLQWDYPAPVYAEALFNLEKFRQLPGTLSLAADGNNPRFLMDRIRRVTGEPVSGKNVFSPLLSFGLIAALFIFTLNSFSRFSKPEAGVQPGTLLTSQINTSMISVTKNTEVMVTSRTDKMPVKHQSEHRLRKPAGHSFKTQVPGPGVQSQKSFEADASPAVLQMHEEDMSDPLQYADQTEVRNYSNEKAAEPELPLLVDMNGVPYVPSASFSYVPGSDTLQPDVLQQDKLKALVAIGKVKTAEIQSKLNEQINRNMKDLRLLKKQSLKLIEQKQKKLEPVLRKIQEDIQIKKAEIKQIQLEMEVQNGEIITI